MFFARYRWYRLDFCSCTDLLSLSLDIVYGMNSIHAHLCAFFNWLTYEKLQTHNLGMVQKAGSARLADIPLTKMGQIMGNNLVVCNTDKFASSFIQTPSVKRSVEVKKIGKVTPVIVDGKGMLRFADILLV